MYMMIHVSKAPILREKIIITILDKVTLVICKCIHLCNQKK